MKNIYTKFIEFDQFSDDNPTRFMQKNFLLEKETTCYLYYKYRSDYNKNRNQELITQVEDLIQILLESKDYFFTAKSYLLLSKLCSLHKSKDAWIDALEKALYYAHLCRNFDLIAEITANLAYFHSISFNILEFDKCRDTVLSLTMKNVFEYTYVECLFILATIDLLQKKSDKAIELFTDIYQRSLKNNFISKQINIINNIGLVHINLNHFQEAEACFKSQLLLCKKHNLFENEFNLLFNIGLSYRYRDKEKLSIHYYVKALDVLTKNDINNPVNYYNIFNNLGNVSHSMGNSEKALEFHRKAIHFAELLGNKTHQMSSLVNQADVEIDLQRYLDAEMHLMQAKKYFTETEDWGKLKINLQVLADLFVEQKEYLKAIDVMEELNQANNKYLIATLEKRTIQFEKKIYDLTEKNANLSKNISISKHSIRTRMPFIGDSPAIQNLLFLTRQAAENPNTNVFIYGESGTGKEIVAHMIHFLSKRKDKPLITVNAASISANIFESEFFGHIKGAFTGAINDNVGYFKSADKGTLFLDEITEISYQTQSKLLRAIETKTVLPVGSQKTINFDCRIIASTNLDINQQILNNLFRLDLFHRLNTFEIIIPPLRERLEDIPLLVEHFIAIFAKETNRRVPIIESSFYEEFCIYRFPGNVRELKNLVERLIIVCPDMIWTKKTIEQYLPHLNFSSRKSEQIQDVKKLEKQIIINALQKSNCVQKDAAMNLKMSESTLTRRIKKYSINVSELSKNILKLDTE